MERLDYFKYDPKMSIRGNEGLKTQFGAILTILLGILILLSVIAFGKELILKENPITISSYVFDERPIISKDQVFVAMAFGYSNGTPITNLTSYLKLSYGYLDYDSERLEEPVKSNFYPNEPCDNTPEFKNNLYGILSILPAPSSFYHCYPNDKKPDVLGDDTTKRFIEWDMSVTLCRNSTDSDVVCKPQEEINNALQYFYVNVVIRDNLIDSRNLKSPITPIYFTSFIRLSILRARLEIYYLSKIEFLSDEAFLLEDYTQTSTFNIVEKINDTMPATPVNLEVYRLLISSKKFVNRITRVYTKIQKVAADIGGIIKFFLICIQFINKSFSKIIFVRILKDNAKNAIIDYLKNKKKVDDKSLEISEANAKVTNDLDVNAVYNFMIKVLENKDDNRKMNKKEAKETELKNNYILKKEKINKDNTIIPLDISHQVKDHSKLHLMPMPSVQLKKINSYQNISKDFVELRKETLNNRNSEENNLGDYVKTNGRINNALINDAYKISEEKINRKKVTLNIKDTYIDEEIKMKYNSNFLNKSLLIDYLSYFTPFACWEQNKNFLKKIHSNFTKMYSHEEFISMNENLKILKLLLIDNVDIFVMYKDASYISSMIYNEQLKEKEVFLNNLKRNVSVTTKCHRV